MNRIIAEDMEYIRKRANSEKIDGSTVLISGATGLIGKSVDALLERNEIYTGQAPEVFRLGKYYEANESLLPEKILRSNGSTEPAVFCFPVFYCIFLTINIIDNSYKYAL